MARGPRMFRPGEIYFITTRTIGRRFLLRPDSFVNDIVGGALGKGIRKHGIKLYAYVVLSNHIHLILSHDDTPSEISDFMKYVKSSVSVKLTEHVNWKGTMWDGRFKASPILNDDELLEKVSYILAHGAKEDLVESPRDWPGVHCAAQMAGGPRQVYHWHDWTRRGELLQQGKTVRGRDYKEPVTIDLTPLPGWEDVPTSEQQRRFRAMVAEIEARERSRRQATGAVVMGVEGVLAQAFDGEPSGEDGGRACPLCFGTEEQEAAYEEEYRDFCQAYHEASAKYRAGDFGVRFPDLAFRPFVYPFGGRAPPG